jgi:hypothetical protein
VSPLAVALGPLILVVALSAWVYIDAKARQGTRHEVVVTIGSFTIDTPLCWLAVCVVVFVAFFPLYLVARREAG